MKIRENNDLSVAVCDELRSVFRANGTQWLEPVILSGNMIADMAQTQESRRAVLQTLHRLIEDDYSAFLKAYYQQGDERFGKCWNYADLLTFLYATSKLLRPRNYLEIGVRRGRSLSIVADQCPSCQIYGFDMWMQDYAGMPNPGPEFVEEELRNCGFNGELTLISGDSHETVPEFFRANPGIEFDLINVDGDHSSEGAKLDLTDVIPHLGIGGVLLLDDITHPQHRYLESIWDELVGSNDCFSTAKYKDLGYGVAVAVRKF